MPPNLDDFIDEIAADIGRLYGPAAETGYRAEAQSTFRAMLAHPDVRIAVVESGADTAALLIAVSRGNVGQISFVHVLEPFRNRDLEAALVRDTVELFRGAGVDAVLCEFIPSCPLELDAVFEELAFERVPRALMMAPLDAKPLRAQAAPESRPLLPRDYDAAAATIADAYVGHPGRKLHIEVYDPKNARDFLDRAIRDEYGPTRRTYLRAIRRDGSVAGVIIGCEAAPGYGFVLQVAVCRDRQNQGIGARLIRELAAEFRRTRLKNVALGVTLDNPARRLYERLGFNPIRLVTAYVWWRTSKFV